jgi:hypothetical protein
MALIEVSPANLVQVLIDDIRHDGTLEAWRETDNRWRGCVRWTVDVGMRRLGWVDQDRLRSTSGMSGCCVRTSCLCDILPS